MATNPFEGAGGGEGVYQLTPGSVSPTRLVSRDHLGRPREETLCCLAKHAKFVDAKGNICTVALQSGRTMNRSTEAQRYEQHMIRDQIDGGCLPVEECPYTQKYEDWIGEANGGRLVALPNGTHAPDCRGKKQPPDWPLGVDFMGCEHMEAIIKLRREAARAEYDAELARSQMTMTQEQANRLMAAAAEGAALGAASRDPRARIREGRSDKD